MRTTRRAFMTAGSLVILGLAPLAAAPTYSFTYVADGDTYNYTVPVDGVVQVPLYLQESSTNPSSSLLADELGLLSAGVGVTRDVSSTATVPATITSIIGNPGATPAAFDSFVIVSHDSTSATISEGTDMLGAQGVSGPQVFLGTVEIHGGSVPGETTRFDVGALILSGAGSTYTFTNVYDLDAGDGSLAGYTNSAGSTFTVTTAVPEPGVLALGAVVSLAALARRRPHGMHDPRGTHK